MSDEKHEQLKNDGKLWPDGSRIEVCPTCLRSFPQGEGLPSGDHAVAAPEPVNVATAAEMEG